MTLRGGRDSGSAVGPQTREVSDGDRRPARATAAVIISDFRSPVAPVFGPHSTARSGLPVSCRLLSVWRVSPVRGETSFAGAAVAWHPGDGRGSLPSCGCRPVVAIFGHYVEGATVERDGQ